MKKTVTALNVITCVLILADFFLSIFNRRRDRACGCHCPHKR